jgi:hypothetical protein
MPVDPKTFAERFPKTALVAEHVSYLGIGAVVGVKKLRPLVDVIAFLATITIVPMAVGSLELLPTSLKYTFDTPLYPFLAWISGAITIALFAALYLWGGEEAQRRKKDQQ